MDSSSREQFLQRNLFICEDIEKTVEVHVLNLTDYGHYEM